ncbi:MAG: twin-arginine translocase subunit TatC [Thermodesulfobacteriota bacterium]|nr:twin-arginine translocase subunit TatC [Thermodesulfobacteriota bacterium]
MNQDKRRPILQHLGELKGRLIKCLIAVAVGIGISFPFCPQIFEILKSRAEGIDLIYTHVVEYLGTYMKLALYCGVALALPFVIYQVIMFISPGLKAREKRYLYSLMPAVALLFISGVAFAYFILLPPALNFLLTFSGEIARPLITIENYVSVIIRLLFAMGLVFEIPLVMSFLNMIGVVTPQWMTKNRKWAFVVAFILGAAITPTMDPVNQTLVAAPIIILWEMSICLAKLIQKRQRRPVPSEFEAPTSPSH